MHLFRYRDGDESYDESRTIEAGREAASFACGDVRVALSICYDLRFPELYRALGDVSLILVPAAFTYPTGLAHWELLLRARAVENQCYVLAAAQGGTHPNGRRTFGHSMLVDPWGEVLARHAEGPGVVIGRGRCGAHRRGAGPAAGPRRSRAAQRRTPTMTEAVERAPAARIRVRTVPVLQPFRWLRLGWRDFTRAFGPSLAHGFVAMMAGLGILAAGLHAWPLLPGAFSGFVLVAPILATGLYELSQAPGAGREAAPAARGRRVGARHAAAGVVRLRARDRGHAVGAGLGGDDRAVRQGADHRARRLPAPRRRRRRVEPLPALGRARRAGRRGRVRGARSSRCRCCSSATST